MTTIGTFAFKENPTLTAIDFSTATHLTILGEKSFIRCFQLKGEVKLPASLNQIGNRAFVICTQLTKVDFSLCDKLTTISSWFFCDCIGLTGILDLTECKTLTTIEEGAFSGANQVEIKHPQSLTTIRDKAFGDKSDSSLCKKVLISATPVKEFNRIKALVVDAGYPEDQIESY